MLAHNRFVWLVPGLIIAAAVAFAGPSEAASEPGSVAYPGISAVRASNPEAQRSLDHSAAWLSFQKQHGAWKAMWNELSGTPHRAIGAGIPLDGYADDAAAVDEAVRGFISRNAGIFGGSPALSTVRAHRVGADWYVSYRPSVEGLPVLFSDWEFRVGGNGRLFSFGVDGVPMAAPEAKAARIAPGVAREAAKAGLTFDPSTDRVEGAEALLLLPVAGEQGLTLRPVYDVRLRTREPLGNWIALVDASSGEVLWRHNRIRYDIGGNVSAMVHPYLPSDPLVSRPLPHLYVNVGASQVVTDGSGNYTAPAAGTVAVSAQLYGLFCDVNRADGTDAGFSTNASNPATVDIAWNGTNSQDSERDAYLNVNAAHDYATTMDPNFLQNDYEMPCAVNINQTCNAYWDGYGVNFFLAGGGCVNTGTMPDVVYHEYGHGVNDNLYFQEGAFSGMINGALHEGMADVNAAFIQDDAVGGKGFFGPGTSLRTADNTNRYPQDHAGEPHQDGLIISGAFWDLRQAVGLAVAEQLAHFAKYGLPDDSDDGIAMNEYFYETLVTDDDDANLANGSPHFAEIVAAFNAHGIGTSFWIDIAHTPLADQTAPGPYPVLAAITYAGPIGSLDTGSPALHYSVNGAGYVTAAMTPTANPNEYGASIPSQTAAIVRYYITASDSYGGAGFDPVTAPAVQTYIFIAGAATAQFTHDQEANQGWVVGAAGDNATTGIWLRANPVGSYVGTALAQPEDDHTPGPGVNCFVTGNAAVGAAAGTNDVDGGHTTVTTPAFDATAGALTNPIVSYYRWYSNDQGSTPGTDFWHADISNDGGASWVSVENSQQNHHPWDRVVFFISDYVTPTANMKMRFIAADEGEGSLVEAAVDDFSLLGFATPVSVENPGLPRAFALAPASPNPFKPRTTLSYSVPAREEITLRVYDVSGRAIRTLFSGAREAGSYRAEWNGRDDAGRPVASGSYFVRLSSRAGRTERTVVLLK